MPQIVVDEKTLAELEAVAIPSGLTVSGYLQSLVEQKRNGNPQAFSVADFERELDELATDANALPRDFSRADIYAEHDGCSAMFLENFVNDNTVEFDMLNDRVTTIVERARGAL
jgi:hypothetical protein